MSYLKELLEDGYTQVVVTGNPELPDEVTVVAKGEAAHILAFEEDMVKAATMMDGKGQGGKVAFLDNPSEDFLVDLRALSRTD